MFVLVCLMRLFKERPTRLTNERRVWSIRILAPDWKSWSLVVLLVVCFVVKPAVAFSFQILAPEITTSQRARVQAILDKVFGSPDSIAWNERRRAAISVSEMDGESLDLSRHESIYGELGLEALSVLLDAVGVRQNETILDIGSGDGMLVASAALLFPEFCKTVYGLEIMPSLYERSLEYMTRLHEVVNDHIQGDDTENNHSSPLLCPRVKVALGDVHDTESLQIQEILSNTTLAVCFATTWSRGTKGRKLPRLSKALGAGLPSESRVVIVDGVLNERQDGFVYGGELRLHCPDTAPYSIAHSYTKL